MGSLGVLVNNSFNISLSTTATLVLLAYDSSCFICAGSIAAQPLTPRFPPQTAYPTTPIRMRVYVFEVFTSLCVCVFVCVCVWVNKNWMCVCAHTLPVQKKKTRGSVSFRDN